MPYPEGLRSRYLWIPLERGSKFEAPRRPGQVLLQLGQPPDCNHHSMAAFEVKFLLASAWVALNWPEARASMMDIISVTTPRRLQESVITGVTHVVIYDHADISKLPSLPRRLGPGAHVLDTQRNSHGQNTKRNVVSCRFPLKLFCRTFDSF